MDVGGTLRRTGESKQKQKAMAVNQEVNNLLFSEMDLKNCISFFFFSNKRDGCY